jgi:hypothetical protein
VSENIAGQPPQAPTQSSSAKSAARIIIPPRARKRAELALLNVGLIPIPIDCDTDMVGREYELIPVHNNQGVFHPKVSAFVGTDNAHVLIGSGNLTFGGWGGNLEVAEHFHAGSCNRGSQTNFASIKSLKGNLIVITRPGLGEYRGTISRNRRTISGTTTWCSSCSWEVCLDKPLPSTLPK